MGAVSQRSYLTPQRSSGSWATCQYLRVTGRPSRANTCGSDSVRAKPDREGPRWRKSCADREVAQRRLASIGVLDVDHGGSTGYGRAYRERLCGDWGVVDVQDCMSGARYLVAHGLVDRVRLAITGKSAGGWTTLCTAAFTDLFRGGVAYFAITDLEPWARGTHKFESHYLDGLVGRYPKRRDLYVERSRTNVGADFRCPVVIVQGLDDRVVPPDQAEKMVGALRAAGKPFAHVEFPDEGHGLRKAANIEQALRAELGLHAAVFGINFADAVEPLTLERAGADAIRGGRG